MKDLLAHKHISFAEFLTIGLNIRILYLFPPVCKAKVCSLPADGSACDVPNKGVDGDIVVSLVSC
jgi:hypothetical protein